MIRPPPLPTRWGRVPLLAPIVAVLAEQARAQHAELRAAAGVARLPIHVVAQLQELDGAELVELEPQGEPASELMQLESLEPLAVQSSEVLQPLFSRVRPAGPASTKAREIGQGGLSGRVARPRWHSARRALPQAVPEAVEAKAAPAARRRKVKHAARPGRPLMREQPAVTHRPIPAPASIPSGGLTAAPRERARLFPSGRDRPDAAERAEAGAVWLPEAPRVEHGPPPRRGRRGGAPPGRHGPGAPSEGGRLWTG
jgi:hypothetical protein